MATHDTVETVPSDQSGEVIGAVGDEKVPYQISNVMANMDEERVERDLNMTEKDLLEARAVAGQMSTEEVRILMGNVLNIHRHDPNFPHVTLQKIKEFLGNEAVFDNPEKHEDLIYEMKLEAALITNNSPYAEVRAVVDNHDDQTVPSSTIRVWVIGLVFSAALGVVNQLFNIRQPNITILANVAQMLAYPLGKGCEKLLPDWGVTLFGVRHSLNPGPFSKKEHMLITIMANVAYQIPYTTNIIWTQYLPAYFNQSYAGSFSYQIIISLGTNFVGYGVAGLTRRFLVYPASCVWPASLVTIALNQAFHNDGNVPVPGPFKKTYRASRYKFFLLAFGGMFVYFWFPNWIFTALSAFSWMTWIAPNNRNLSTITGFSSGLGLNPLGTFDWNNLLFDQVDPIMVPFFTTFNKFVGMFTSMFVIIGLWFSNAYNTGYLPINSNRVFDNRGKLYNVSRAIDEHGLFDSAKYEAYSPPFLSAGYLTLYIFFFALYPATLMYTYLFHKAEVVMGFKNLINSLRKNKDTEIGQYKDVHNKIMTKYPEVPEWWYLIVLFIAIAFGIAGIAGWETYTTPGVVFFGLALCLVFVIPVGMVKSMTGVEITLNVLAEFIGGAWAEGNALAMNLFKTFGYVTCAHAVWFSNDLKLAHYVHIPPRHTFAAQMIATLVSTFVCVAILNFQMNRIDGVCTPDQPQHYTCPGINNYFTAAVLWGTVGPRKVFGKGGIYAATLIGWPLGVVVPLAFWLVQRRWPASRWVRQVHPVAMLYGGQLWAPYNLSYVWPAVPIAWLSWMYVKPRYLAFWSKYNFVLSAALSSGIAIAAIVMFFALQWNNRSLEWWGNEVTGKGCEGSPCKLKTLQPGETFGPPKGSWH